MNKLLLPLGLLFPLLCYAAPGCKSASKVLSDGEKQTLQICIKQGTFAHDLYIVRLNGSKVLEKIDDEMLAFETSSAGKAIKGACTPQSELHEVGGMKMPIEVGRVCKVSVDEQAFDALEFKFD